MLIDIFSWLLWCAYARYGGVARVIFDKLRFGDHGVTTSTILGEISQWDFQVTTKAARIAQVQVDVSAIMWPETTAHQVIMTRPMAIGSEGARMTRVSVIGGGKSPIEHGYISGCGTAHVLKIVFLACKKYHPGRAEELFQQLSGEPDSRTCLGNLFENLLHAVPSPQEAITSVSDETDTNQDGPKTRSRRRAAPAQSERISGQPIERLRTRTKKNYIRPATISPPQTGDEDSSNMARNTRNRKQAAPVDELNSAPRKHRAVKKTAV